MGVGHYQHTRVRLLERFHQKFVDDTIQLLEKFSILLPDFDHLIGCPGRERTCWKQGVVPVKDRQCGRLSLGVRIFGSRVPDTRVGEFAEEFISMYAMLNRALLFIIETAIGGQGLWVGR